VQASRRVYASGHHALVPDEYETRCFLCGEGIERTSVDPGSMTLAPGWGDPRFADGPRQNAWFHAACLRQHADPSIPLRFQFWDDYDGDDGRSAEGEEPAEP
jgi:hypothetical protein